MFKILTLQQCGEGIQRYVPPAGYEDRHFHAIEEAAEILWNNYGHGMVATSEGTHVLSI